MRGIASVGKKFPINYSKENKIIIGLSVGLSVALNNPYRNQFHFKKNSISPIIMPIIVF
jgi:hypothetical protein